MLRGVNLPDRPRRIPEATVARLPLYYRALVEMAEQRIPTVSSERLREMAGVDADPAKCGKEVGGLVVEPLRDLPRLVAERDVAIGIIATPAAAAQEVAELLVSAGVTSVLNFAPIVIAVPAGVSLRKVDLSI